MIYYYVKNGTEVLILKKIIALITAIAVSFMLCGCYNPMIVGTGDGIEIPAGIYLYYQLVAADNAMVYGDSYVSDLKTVYEMQIEDVSGRQWIARETVDGLREYIFLEEEFDRLGIEITDDEQLNFTYMIYSNWNSNSSVFTRNGIGYESYTKAAMNSYKKSMILEALYIDDGAEFKVPDNKIADEYDRLYCTATVMELPMSYSAYNELGVDGIAELRADTEKMVAALKSGKSYEEAFNQYADPLFELARHEKAEFHQYIDTDLTLKQGTTDLDSRVVNALFELEPGEFDYFLDYTHIYIFGRETNDADAWQEHTYEMVESLVSDEFNDYIEGGKDSVNLNLDQKAVSYYSLDKVIM